MIVPLEEFKIKSKETKKAVTKDKKSDQESDLGEQVSSSHAWKSARNTLGMKKTLFPTAVKAKDGSLITNPCKLANMCNGFFLEKDCSDQKPILLQRLTQ